MEYGKLLDEAYRKIKPIKATERFEVPLIEGHIEGNKTIISNFRQICDSLRRECPHVEKFLERELAAPGKLEGNRMILTKKVSSARINEKIRQYVEEFVLCKECKKPDTELIKDHQFLFVHCLACGAKHSVRTRI